MRSRLRRASASWASSRARLAWACSSWHLEGARIDDDQEVALADLLALPEGDLHDLSVHPASSRSPC